VKFLQKNRARELRVSILDPEGSRKKELKLLFILEK
jgi:hypothetical protein